MDLHWRNSQKPARFWMLDARAFGVFLLFLVHMRLWTLIATILVMTIFYMFERRGLTFEAALRAIRSWFLGSRRPANSRRARRRWVDYNS